MTQSTMSTCAIMQPTYLPWSGFFNLILSVDAFVFLDDVQYQKRSWQTRNRICLNGREHLLTVPVKKCPQSTLLHDVLLSEDQDWQQKHYALIEQAYRKCAFGEELLELVSPGYLESSFETLTGLTMSLTRSIATALGADAEFHVASELNCGGSRSAHLHSICERLGAQRYLSPIGSREYLIEDDFENMSDISLAFQDYRPTSYPQSGGEDFISHLSVIDVIANIGLADAKSYCEGRWTAS